MINLLHFSDQIANYKRENDESQTQIEKLTNQLKDSQVSTNALYWVLFMFWYLKLDRMALE